MRRIIFAVSVLAAALTVGACGTSAGDEAADAVSNPTSAQPTSAADGAGQDCAALQWPRPLPDFHGKDLGKTVVGSALCFTIVSVTASDGHDVMHDAAAATTQWTITGQQPAAGTSVAADAPVSLTVDAPH